MNQTSRRKAYMPMAPIDDDNLPEQLQHDLHRLLPSPPADIANRERKLLDRAHISLNQQRGRRTGWRWLAAGAAVAAMLLVAVTLFRSGDNPLATSPVPVAAAHKPTIIDAMIAARRPGVKQPDIDQIAMAAVRIDSPEAPQ